MEQRRGFPSSVDVAALLLTAGVCVAILANASPYLRGPAPYPPDWQWPLRQRLAFGRLGFSIGVLLLLYVVGAWSVRQTKAWSPVSFTATLGMVAVLAFALQLALVSDETDRGGLTVVVERIRAPMFTSYYTVAVHPMCNDVTEFLKLHARTLHLLPCHAKTHPIGAILFYRGIREVCEAWPALTRTVVETAHFFGVQFTAAEYANSPAAIATALLGGVCLMALAAASCVSFGWLARLCGMQWQAAVSAAGLWACVPAFSLMTPEFDQLLALPVTASAACMAGALRHAAGVHGRLIACVSAGVAAGLACLISLGSLVFVGFGWLTAFLAAGPPGGQGVKSFVACAATASCALLATFFVPSCWGHDTVGATRHALENHAAFIAGRSYLTWLLFNLADIGLFISPAVMWFLAVATGTCVAGIARTRDWSVLARAGRTRLVVGTMSAFLMSDVAGIVRGEAARTWIPVMPFLLLAGLAAIDTPRLGVPLEGNALARGITDEWQADRARRAVCFICLAMTCLVIRVRWIVP